MPHTDTQSDRPTPSRAREEAPAASDQAAAPKAAAATDSESAGIAPKQNPDYDLPGNDLNPNTLTPEQRKSVPLILKIYGVLCTCLGIITLPLIGAYAGIALYRLSTEPESAFIGTDITLTTTLTAIDGVLNFVGAAMLIIYGWTLLRSYRRDAARWSYVLIALTVAQILTAFMLQGLDLQLISPIVQLLILLVISVTIDPSLQQERQLQRHLRDLVDREAARAGMLGRDLSGEGYIKLNFFNLFWVFMVCCVLGLILEVIWHMVVVEPGVYQDRAGLLFGPFSPIYGFGAVLLTVALNRFYNKNFLIIFLVSAVIGGTFEAAVSWWMQTSFGAIAWSYSTELMPGIPDPVAMLYGGRTSLPFAAMWGVLGVVWIKVCLPRLLELINLIPWKMRYSLTTATAVLMLMNGCMTLGALDCWFTRESGLAPASPVEEFFAEHFDNEYMEHRFQSMTITPESSSRLGDGAHA